MSGVNGLVEEEDDETSSSQYSEGNLQAMSDVTHSIYVEIRRHELCDDARFRDNWVK